MYPALGVGRGGAATFDAPDASVSAATTMEAVDTGSSAAEACAVYVSGIGAREGGAAFSYRDVYVTACRLHFKAGGNPGMNIVQRC